MKQTALVTDACIMITFGNANALDLLTGIQRFTVVTTERAVGEVSRPPAQTAVAAAVEAGEITIDGIDISDSTQRDTLQRFDNMPAFRNRADAELLTLAVCRGEMILCSDETAMRRAATAEIGHDRVAGTLDVLVWAVRESRITADAAGTLLPSLDVGPSLLARLASRGMTFQGVIRN